MVVELKTLYNYYKDLKLGVGKAEKFLSDLERELIKISKVEKSNFFFKNVFNDKIFFFEDSLESRKKIDEILSKLMLNYFVLRGDLLYQHEYSEAFDVLRNIACNYLRQNFNCILDDILSLKVEDKIQKEDIIHNLLVLELKENNFNPMDYKKLLSNYGAKIINFCVFNDLEENLRHEFVKEFLLNPNQEKNLLFERIFNKKLKNFLILEIITYKLIQWVAEINNDKQMIDNYQNKIIDFNIFVAKPLFDYLFRVESFKHSFKIEDNLIFLSKKPEFSDILDLKLPSLQLYDLRSCYFVDNVILEEKYLKPLNICRIKLNLKYLSRIYDLNFHLFEKICIRYRAKDNQEKITRYACDFLGTHVLANFHLNENLSKYYLEILNLVNLIFVKRIHLNEKIFRNIVMSCFPNVCLKKELFFDKKDKWVNKKRK